MKKYMSALLILICALSMIGCNNKSMNYIIENEPNITGIVEEVYEKYVIIYCEEMMGYPYGARCSVSLDVENSDSYTDFSVGDEVIVYYDGITEETDPLGISTVYAITLKTPASRNIYSE